MINQIKEESKPSTSNNTTDKKETYYRVVVGSYKDKNTATKVMNEAKTKGYKDAFLVAFEK